MLTKELEKLGLNSRESKVYLTLLQLGKAAMQEISEKSSDKRTTVYGVIKSLKEKGLLRVVIGENKILYCAQNPKKMEENLKKRQQTLEKVMPDLLKLSAISSVDWIKVPKNTRATIILWEIIKETKEKFPTSQIFIRNLELLANNKTANYVADDASFVLKDKFVVVELVELS